MTQIGINGFGRIGRAFLRRCLRKSAEVVAINDPNLNAEYLAYLLKYDSTHGRLNVSVCSDTKTLLVNGKKICIYGEKDPAKIRWKDVNATYILECSGMFTNKSMASKHFEGGAEKVIISATSPDAPIFISGVNFEKYNSDMKVISCGSCTMNALAPLAKIVNETFCIVEGFMTTIHAVAPNQNLLDGSGPKWREARSGLQNFFPMSSDVARTMCKTMPELAGKLTGMAFRVPIANVSAIDLTVRLEKPANIDYLNEKIKEAADGCFKGILAYTDDEVVSSDFRGYSKSLVYDSKASISLNDKLHKLIAWYDNEYGYSARLLDLCKYIQKKDSEDKEPEEKDKCK